MMHRSIRATIGRLIGKGMSPSSLQFRLTLELITLSMIGLGGIALWAGWQMEQNLGAAHKETLKYIAMRFPENLALYSDSGPAKTALERTVDKVSAPGLSVWVEDPKGMLLAQDSAALAREVATVVNIPEQPTIVHVSGRDIVSCGTPLTVQGKKLGKLYLAQDITMDQQNLKTGLWRLMILSAGVILILMVTIATRIRKALHPLEQMSQVASGLSADDLEGAKLQLHEAPDEILGLAQAFNDMLMRLSGAWAQQRQFVGNVSHELRTPLTVILGYLQSLLRRSTNLSPYQQQAIATATAETERTIRMLQDLLDLARAESGQLHFRLSPMLLNAVVTEVAAMTQRVSDRPINLLLTEEEVVTCADQDRLQQVLINLVENAIKYSDPKQPIDLILEKTTQHALIHVRDRGMGIPLAQQHRIFERFYRGDDSMTRSRDGTGLGLAIAKSLIEGMAGQITLRSKPEEGSTFTITLPLWPCPQSAITTL